MYYGSFATSEESVLKFEMLNPTLFLWPSIYPYVESVIHLDDPIEVWMEECCYVDGRLVFTVNA